MKAGPIQSPASEASVNIHATCVAIDDVGVLLRGPSGAGKSDLALRLIDAGAELVADDRVDLSRVAGRLVAAAPPALAGLVEVAGIGPLRMACRAQATVGLIVDLVDRAALERLPPPSSETLLGIRLPRHALDAFGVSAPIKLRLLVAGAPVVNKANTQ